MVRRALIPALLLALVGCQASSHAAAPTTTTGATTTSVGTVPAGAGASTTIAIQASGPRTVLSPVGLNVRAQPSKTATVAGTAAQGAVVTVLGHTDGWYQVKGATVTGYISDDATLSAAGTFQPYNSNADNFAALFPMNWTTTVVPPAGVVFRPPSGPDTVVVTTAATTSLLPRAPSGYRRDADTVVVVCGVTGDLFTFDQANPAPVTSTTLAGAAAPLRYLALVHLTLDAQHALGLQANLADLADLATVTDIMYSLSFPFPQCEQGATPATSSTVPASTVP